MDLGLERAGMECAWQVEIDPFCRRVLTKHWPNVPKYNDVREVGKHNLEPVDLIAGGFPCQDISFSGNGAGIDGARSGLWREFARIVSELRPRLVLVENVPALLDRGMGRVLGDLAALRYDAEWDCIPAFALGAGHRRDRVFIVGNAMRGRLSTRVFSQKPAEMLGKRHRSRFGFDYGEAWHGEPELAVLVDGLPDEVDATRGLGNAVVPRVAQWIGERILESKGLQIA